MNALVNACLESKLVMTAFTRVVLLPPSAATCVPQPTPLAIAWTRITIFPTRLTRMRRWWSFGWRANAVFGVRFEYHLGIRNSPPSRRGHASDQSKPKSFLNRFVTTAKHRERPVNPDFRVENTFNFCHFLIDFTSRNAEWPSFHVCAHSLPFCFGHATLVLPRSAHEFHPLFLLCLPLHVSW